MDEQVKANINKFMSSKKFIKVNIDLMKYLDVYQAAFLGALIGLNRITKDEWFTVRVSRIKSITGISKSTQARLREKLQKQDFLTFTETKPMQYKLNYEKIFEIIDDTKESIESLQRNQSSPKRNQSSPKRNQSSPKRNQSSLSSISTDINIDINKDINTREEPCEQHTINNKTKGITIYISEAVKHWNSLPNVPSVSDITDDHVKAFEAWQHGKKCKPMNDLCTAMSNYSDQLRKLENKSGRTLIKFLHDYEFAQKYFPEFYKKYRNENERLVAQRKLLDD